MFVRSTSIILNCELSSLVIPSNCLMPFLRKKYNNSDTMNLLKFHNAIKTWQKKGMSALPKGDNKSSTPTWIHSKIVLIKWFHALSKTLTSWYPDKSRRIKLSWTHHCQFDRLNRATTRQCSSYENIQFKFICAISGFCAPLFGFPHVVRVTFAVTVHSIPT